MTYGKGRTPRVVHSRSGQRDGGRRGMKEMPRTSAFPSERARKGGIDFELHET